MRAFLTLLLLILSGIATASSPIAIPPFPSFGDCHQYAPVGKRPWRGKLVAPPGYMECTTEEGVKFSISESDYYNGSSWLEWMGKGSDVQPEYDFFTIGDAMRPVSILDTAPFLIVSYKAPIGFQEVTVIFLRDKKNGPRPFLITTGRQSRTANHLKYAYQDQKNNWISNYQFTYMHEDGYKKKEIPSSFPYYAFSQVSEGAHCCFNIILIDKNKPHRVSHYWENMDFEPWFGDVNNDGEYEMFAPDYSYLPWPDSFAGSPAPRLVWRITPSGFSLAPDLMIEPPLDQVTLKSQIEWIGDNIDSDSLYLPYELYGTTLDLIYSGNEQRAWEFFDDAWPTLIETKNQEDFRKDFKGMICSSLFADSLNAEDRHRFLRQSCDLYSDEVTVSYEGGTYTGELSNNVPHGQGTLITLYGSRYFGEWKGGKRHGQGEQMYSGGANYVGEWREGSFWGHGTFTSADGSKHVGEWKYGQPNGQGTFTSSDGSMYVGEWQDSNMHGNGIYTYPSGDIYDGQWKLSTKHGHGTLTSTNGSKYVGYWKYGMKYGHGTYTWLDGTKYVGEFKDGKFHGDGVLTVDGSKYVGEFKHGEYQGPGSFANKTGDQISDAATVSGTTPAYQVIDIPLFPDIGDCLKYHPLDRRTAPRYMECSNLEGDKFSVPANHFDRDVGVGSDADLLHGLQPAAKVVDVPPVTIVFYVDKEHLYSSAVMYEQKGSDFLTGIKPVLVLGGHLSPSRLRYYGDSCDNWITVAGEGSYCDSDAKEEVPSDFPYYVFSIHSGGNHCCFDLIIVDKESPHHVLYEYDGSISAPRFKDIDNDGQYEMVVHDYDSYTYALYGPGFVPLAPDVIWHMTPFGLYVAPELMLKPLPTAATLANYKRSINDGSGRSEKLLFEVTLDLIYSGHEMEAWKFFDDAWPEFFKFWSRYDQWNSYSNTQNLTQKEKEEFYKEQFHDKLVEDVCTSHFARYLSGTDRQHFLGQTCH